MFLIIFEKKNMQVHLFTNEGIYQTTFINFIEEQTHLDKRFYVFRNRGKQKHDYVFRSNNTLLYCTNFWSLTFRLLPLLFRSSWIYVHYLPYGPSLFILLLIRRLLKKSTWIIWGGDLYIYRNRKLSLRSKLFEITRKKIIPKFAEIASFLEGDAILAKKLYRSQAKFRPILYPLPIPLNSLPEICFNEKIEFTVLLGNSADPSNHHIEALRLMSRFNKEKLRIICPLSYYSDEFYINDVISVGSNLFGNKFHAITDFISKEEYIKLLSITDICIMNHDRQQALGNIIPLIYLGKKIYLRKDITTYSFLKNNNLAIFEIEDIIKTNWVDFIHFDKINKSKNKEIIYSIASTERCVELWKVLLDRT
jgi:dTDP-N-acetylfucosamine:lipid II N-acetylfucosaminyltransferase